MQYTKTKKVALYLRKYSCSRSF